MTSTVLSKRGKNDGITVYIPKETILKETAAKIKLSQHFFLHVVQELSNSTSYKYPVELKCKYIQWKKGE
jgi:hypothetical protein